MIPELPSRLGKTSHIKDIDGNPQPYTVVDEEKFIALSNKEKAFYLQKLRFDSGKEVFRICYYMIAHKPRMRGKWAFGQFAPMISKEDMRVIFQKLKDKGWV